VREVYIIESLARVTGRPGAALIRVFADDEEW
jgi:hypothetical protein